MGKHLTTRGYIMIAKPQKIRNSMKKKKQRKCHKINETSTKLVSKYHFCVNNKIRLPRCPVSIHFHVFGINGRIHHHPSPSTKFSVGRDVNEYRLVIFPEGVHDVRTEF